jgi:hypothetical protein
MSHRPHTHLYIETPIERIFRNVMRRKMTAQERVLFHLPAANRPPPLNGFKRAATK